MSDSGQKQRNSALSHARKLIVDRTQISTIDDLLAVIVK